MSYKSYLTYIFFALALISCGGGGGGGGTGGGDNTPTVVTRAEVTIAFDQAVTNLAGLQFTLNNTAGATFDNNAQQVFAINNAAAGAQTLVTANFDAAANSTRIALVNAGVNGFNTGTTAIIKVTFAIADGAALPTFSINQTPGSFIAVDAGDAATIPAVTAANAVVTAVFSGP
ncbi:MAG: hypothetical protein HZB61_07875 [Nitrospirae bacterium]|nr:hypothetical protein [Nitrospirota bacterium]